ncbi:SH3 domain-containing protein [Tumidithrix elongata RA019]|uniref:SH3 domain-containing protein n=1 Tax=Tumidithrix elongata BACA0141 TaxID=2716417 RepID=A0AAW9Q380_9CYAN|nr:SH3 domain-containing protein [Tumidithrix elongata RA019]
MKRIISQLLVLAIGLSLNVVAIETTSIDPVMARMLCQSYKVTRSLGLYVYVNAGSRIITTLPYGNIVRVTGMSSNGEWARIEYLRVDGRTGRGWVAASYLSCYQE